MTRLGQHFLKNESAIRKIVEALALSEGDAVIEIGPGHGELTAEIAWAKKSVPKKIVAIEKDPALAQTLTKKFLEDPPGGAAREAALKNSLLEIREGDALAMLPHIADEKIFAANPWKLVGNIPYYITGKLLRIIGELHHQPTLSVLMIQREVAERICVAPPHMNRLAASVQFWADVRIVAHVPKKDFSPQPEVDSAVILLTTRPEKLRGEAAQYYKTIRILFSQPRKTILNNVFSGVKDTKKADIEGILGEISINPALRAQNLSIEQIKAIASAFFP